MQYKFPFFKGQCVVRSSVISNNGALVFIAHLQKLSLNKPYGVDMGTRSITLTVSNRQHISCGTVRSPP